MMYDTAACIDSHKFNLYRSNALAYGPMGRCYLVYVHSCTVKSLSSKGTLRQVDLVNFGLSIAEKGYEVQSLLLKGCEQ